MVTRPRLWLKTTSEKGPHLSCVVFTTTTTRKFVVADPVETTNLIILDSKIMSTSRSNKDHEPHKMESRNFIRGRPCRDHKPSSGARSCLTGTVKTTNLAIWSTKIMSLAGPAKPYKMESQSFRPCRDHKPGLKNSYRPEKWS